MISQNSRLLRREDSVLVLIDIQERLLPAIRDKESVLKNAAILARFAGIIGLPVLLTEQEKLGPTVPAIRDVVPEVPATTKVTFDCFGCEEFTQRLESLNRKCLVIAGLEAHICISQTALSALERFTVHVVSDAVGSRTEHNWRTALDRMRQQGVVVSSTEMAMYELLERAGTPEFKAVLPLVK